MRKIDECDVQKFGPIDGSKQTIAILGDRWRPQKAKREGDRVCKKWLETYGKIVLGAQLLVSLLRVGTVLRLDLDAWPMVK